ncbi:MAG: hypothetical protein ABSF94_13025 [Steroidobacteraceae bacterium]|jgi:hypothetical protein
MKYPMGMIALAALMGCSPSARQTPSDEAPASGASAAGDPSAEVNVQNAKPAARTTWAYHEEIVPATKEKLVFASVNSLNTIEFGFPYAGAQRATLLLQPRSHSPTIRLIIENGQFLCRSSTDGSNGCYVPVKFDNGGLDIWYAQMSNDGRTNVLDFGTPDDDPKNGASCIADELAKMKSLSLKVTFYYEGDRTVDFNVAGLGELPLPAATLSKRQLEDCHPKRAR